MTATSEALLPQSVSAPPTPRLTKIFNRLQPSPETVVLILAVLIGGITGMGVVTFHYLIQLIHDLLLVDLMGVISVAGAWTLACIPMIGGITVGLMRWRWQNFGPGIFSLIAAVQGGQELTPLRPVTKMVAASVSLGTGASLGPEGPSVEIGANFGMLLGQILQVSRERQRLLLGAGAAAGLAAGFNAPIAGVFFALEVVLGTTFATSAVSVVLLAAVVASLIAQIGLGTQPAFTLPVYEVRSPLEMPLYAGLGLCASLVSITYTTAIKLAQRCFQGEVVGFGWLGHQVPRAVHPVIGGICVGLAALQVPQVLGVGYETLEAMLQDVQFTLQFLIILLVVKLLLTAVSLGSGLVGGIFAPAMFLGASLGSAYGKIMAAILPSGWLTIAAPPAYAMVGMAAVLAGSARAPLTAILLLFELTQDYRIVLPLMAAVGLSIWVVERLKPISTNALDLPQMGVNVEKDPNPDLLKQVSVGQAMYPSPPVLVDSLSVLEAGLKLIQGHHRSGLVLNQSGELVGIVTLQDINRIVSLAEKGVGWQKQDAAVPPTQADLVAEHLANQKIGTFCTVEILYAYEDEPVAEALDRMAARGLHQLPVVSRNNPHQVLGLLEREGVALACAITLTNEVLSRHLTSDPQLSKSVA